MYVCSAFDYVGKPLTILINGIIDVLPISLRSNYMKCRKASTLKHVMDIQFLALQ